MKYYILIMLLAGSCFGQETRNIRDCATGGIYLNNPVEYAMCWGDDRVMSDVYMGFQGFQRVYSYPSTPDAQFYQAGLVFGSDVEVVRLLFRNDSLVEIYCIMQNIGKDIVYKNMAQTYEEFRDYFTVDSNGYTMLKDTPSDKVFQGQFSDCSGDCGSTSYMDKDMDIESYLFITGKAHEEALFVDDKSFVGIRIEVPQWDLVYNSGVHKFKMNWPYFTICFSEPHGSMARKMSKIKRRK